MDLPIFEETYNKVNWDQVFELCQKKLRNTDSYGLRPFLLWLVQKWEYKKTDTRS